MVTVILKEILSLLTTGLTSTISNLTTLKANIKNAMNVGLKATYVEIHHEDSYTLSDLT